MIELLVVYSTIAALLFSTAGAIWLMSTDEEDRSTVARLLFVAPVWPVLIVPAIRALWADTGWGKR